MIHSIKCKNFYSFKDEVIVDFTVNSKAPETKGYVETASGVRLSKIMAVVGPNASGKTNILKVLPFLTWLIMDSFSLNPDKKNPILPFKFGKSEKKPTELEVVFEIKENIYSYFFKLTPKRILEEELKVKNKSQERMTFKSLFKREWDSKKEAYNFKNFNFKKLSKDFEKGTMTQRENASIISAAYFSKHEKSREIVKSWKKLSTNVREKGVANNHLELLLKALHFFDENKKLKKEAEKLLARFEIGFNLFDIKKEEKEDGRVFFEVSTVHDFEGKKYRLPFEYESQGTKQLFILLTSIFRVLDQGGIAVLDEFEVNLHPDMIAPLIDLFYSSETNPHNAQIIFSTHNHLILNSLDKYQIWLCEKNEKGASEGWRLDEMEGVRSDDNYFNKYMAGAYGAVPNIE